MNGNDTNRIEAFSDAVMAIAITLLVIELAVPHLKDYPEGTTLFGALLEQWPSYVAYAISFLVLGETWANHHNRFRYIARTDHVLLFLNLLFLMFYALTPFSAALLAEYILGTDGERTTR